MFSFFRSVLSEDGQGSASRVISMLVVTFVLGWITHVVWKTHAVPDLSNVSLFMGTGVGVPYGTNRIAAAYESVKGTKQ